jgi:cell division transport system permease protein
VTLDDHRRWQAQIRTITRSFALGGLAILLLVGAATTAVIVSATKSAMASNRDIVEVLHFVGATDRFIAREFERHFLRLGVRAGIVGAIWAMFVFLIMPTVMELLGGGTVTITEIRA